MCRSDLHSNTLPKAPRARTSLAGFEIITALYQSVLSKSAIALPVDRNITPQEEIVP